MKKLSLYTDEFDVIYPSHGSVPVSPDLIAKLAEGAEQIINGTGWKERLSDIFGAPGYAI